MRARKHAIAGMFGVVALLVAVAPQPVADAAAFYEPPVQEETPTRARLVADKQFGFAPMMVTLSGMLESKGGTLLPIEQMHDVVLVVDSPFLHLSNSSGSQAIATDFHYEATMSGPSDPSAFTRVFELRRPGRYLFRIRVLDQDGKVLKSNEVTIKAM